MHPSTRSRRAAATSIALSALLLAGCGTTVPLSSRGAAGTSDGLSASTTGTTGSAAAGTAGAGGSTGSGSSGSTSGSGSSTGASSGSTGSGATGGATSGGTGLGQGPSNAGQATKGFGWDAKSIYVGVPTADDFNEATKSAGANFNNGDVHGDFDALASDVNKRGGILGRRLVIAYHDAPTTQYSSNPAGTAQSMCSYFTQDRPVVAVISGSPQLDGQPNFHTCLEKKDVTLLSLTNTVYSNHDYLRLGPHLLSVASMSTDILVPTFVNALKRRGFFSGWNTALGGPGSGPARVGLLLPDDSAGHYVGGLFKASLKAAGQQVVKEFYYPPMGSGSQAQSEVLAFSSAKVTHVLKLPPVELEVALFQRQAENQHYRPRYGYTVFDLPLTVEENPVVAAPVQQIGSLGIGWSPLNDVNAGHDVGDMPGGKRCFAALAAGGQVFDAGSRRAKFAGSLACDAVYLLRDAMVAAKGLTGDDLLRGVQLAGKRFAAASTFGSVLSAADHGVPGYYRDSAYSSGCSCFTYVSGNHAFSARGQ